MSKRFVQRAMIVGVSAGLLGFGAETTLAFSLSDWGIADAAVGLNDPTTTEGKTEKVGTPATGKVGSVYYWEEAGVTNDWGFVQPGYGGVPFDILGLYVRWDASYLYVASILGMPPAGSEGLWNGTTWGGKQTLGDLAIGFGSGGTYQYAVETLETLDAHAGTVYKGGTWDAPPAGEYPASAPLNMSGGTDTGLGAGFTYGLAGSSITEPWNGASKTFPLYFLEARILLPDEFGEGVPINIHLTQTCGNDVADLTVIPAPEPGTLVLLGSGVLGLVGVARRRSRA